MISAVLAPLGGLLTVIAGATAGSEYLYTSSMDGIIVFYIKIVSLRFPTVITWEQHELPFYAELGFRTDQYEFQSLGNWYYYPQVKSLFFLANDPYISDWPPVPDPYLTFLCYDESTSTYVDGVPLYINDTLVGVTGSTLFLTPGNYTIQMENYGGDSFHYFDVNGTSVYDNPATIEVSEEDFTVTAHYYRNPMHLVTLNAYNQYSYPGNLLPVYVDSQLAGYTDSNGAFSVLVPEGIHSIEIAYYVDDQYDNFAHFEYPQWTTHTLWYLYLGGSYWYGGAYLEVTSDLVGEAHYDSNG